MNPVDLAFTPALEQARLIRAGQITPIDLVELYLERIQRLDPQLGSYYTVIADQALADARAKTEALVHADRASLPPFFGVPISIKDLNALAGVRCTYGAAALADNIAGHDDGVVTRIKQAGFVILGKTATPELGSLPYTETEVFPPARNPWNLDYTPGGSSGGAAAALAAGLCPISQGSDGGGSIRGPAFCCGVVGIKPARGRVSQAPVGDSLSGLATDGPIARTVADAAALLDVMAGYITGDPYWLPTPQPSFLEVARQAETPPLKIAFATTLPLVGEVDPLCQQPVLEVVQLLAEMGHHLEEGCPDFSTLVDPFVDVWQSAISAAGIPTEYLGSVNRWLLSRCGTCGDYLRAVATVQQIGRRIVAFFDTYDVLILPTYTHPTIRVGEWADLDPESAFQNIIHWVAPCPPFNASGQPAIALPIGFTPEGLPLGVQLVGRPADESTLIALAAQIEAARPWSNHRPDWATV
ncbi:amidase [Leptolyngbya sp. 'hensonii']|uniref:amidase n=1 Tax=Leptolyngbya sp. 'hensonii' TaxID=1922337 RepID=UPI00094FDBF0|nr:amidase [Leptolyngbya sp. 'hensonii']OLP16160.1 amidase [Leptolyngbya sp. 'hensonii']